MYFPQIKEEDKITSTEETDESLPGNSEQASINIAVLQQKVIQQDNRQHHVHQHQLVDQQVVQVDPRQKLPQVVLLRKLTQVRSENQEGSSEAFAKLKKATRQLYDSRFDVDVSKFDIPASNVPEVYPEILSVNFYERRFIPKDDQYDPKARQIEFRESDNKVSIDQLVSEYHSKNFISIVGYAGSGKTTLSKRLARRLDQTEDFLVLRILFMSMSDCDDEKLTLKEFLLGDVKFNLNVEETTFLFKWIKLHPRNCFFIFDGFDQVNWNLLEKAKISDYDTLLTCQELVSNLCRGMFLPNCHIVFTSRPHAMLKIPQKCRPKQTYFIRDLTSENVKTLFDAIINNEQTALKLWNKLTLETPHLKSLCHNPLMLQLYLQASLGVSHEMFRISTTTRLFQALLESFKSSEHAISLRDKIITKLSKIAFRATKDKTTLITSEFLVEENLFSQEIQDIVVTLFGFNRTCGLLEDQRRLYFSHQTYQGFFSALYIAHQMSLESFESFVQNNFLSSHWSIVVQFLSGLLLDPYMNKDLLTWTAVDSSSSFACTSTSQVSSSSSKSFFAQRLKRFFPLFKKPKSSWKPTHDHLQESSISVLKLFHKDEDVAANEKSRKSEIFMSELNKKIPKVSADLSRRDDSIFICKIVREGFVRRRMSIDTSHDHFHAVTAILNSISDPIGKHSLVECEMTPNELLQWIEAIKPRSIGIHTLQLSSCFMTSNEFLPWIEAIKSIPGSITRLNIDNNQLSSVDDIIAILDKVEEELSVRYCLDDGHGGIRRLDKKERTKLQEALDGLKYKKLMVWDG